MLEVHEASIEHYPPIFADFLVSTATVYENSVLGGRKNDHRLNQLLSQRQWQSRMVGNRPVANARDESQKSR